MKKWNFKVKGSPLEVVRKLETALESFGGFIFKINQNKNDITTFNFRKPVKYPDQILHRNRTIVKGKVIKTADKNETKLEITFSQHFFMILTVLSVVLLGLVLMVIIPTISDGMTMFILEGVVIALGAVLWIAIRKKFERDIQKHKTLISEILVPSQ